MNSWKIILRVVPMGESMEVKLQALIEVLNSTGVTAVIRTVAVIYVGAILYRRFRGGGSVGSPPDGGMFDGLE